METYCANKGCTSHTTRRGGKFVFRGGKWLCPDCATYHYAGEPGKNLWDFQTMNIAADANAGPVQVKSLRHLRQLERQHGVVSVAANMDSRNW